MSRPFLVTILTFSAIVAGCDAPTRPLRLPTPTPSPTPPPLVVHTVVGQVFDTSLKPLANARVEVMDGPQAGAVMTSDADGRFSHTSTITVGVRFRASKAGYLDATRASEAPLPGSGGPYVNLYLELIAPRANIAGDYTMTFVADDSCTVLPPEVRTRKYIATVTPSSSTEYRANTFFNGQVSGATLLAERDSFFVGAAGRDLGFVFYNWEGEGASLVERLSPNTYLAIYGRADTPATSTGEINVSFDGTIDYCVAASGSYESCYLAKAATNQLCTSKHHRLVLTRR
jgi:hypothetical protein